MSRLAFLDSRKKYAHVPYPHAACPADTIKTAGECPTVIAMILGELGIVTDPSKIAKFALMNGDRLPKGTDVEMLIRHASKAFNESIVVTTTNSIEILRSSLLRGAKLSLASAVRRGYSLRHRY